MQKNDNPLRTATEPTPLDDYKRHGDARRRGTIPVLRKPLPSDQKWFGAAPRPVPEADKNWRRDFKF